MNFTEEQKETIITDFYKDFADQLSYSNELLTTILLPNNKDKEDKKEQYGKAPNPAGFRLYHAIRGELILNTDD